MPDLYHHGVTTQEISGGTRPISLIATNVIGFAATASDADPATFPIDTAVLITDVRSAIGKAGTKGTLAATLQGIADQCSPLIVAVRVAEAETPEQTTSAVIGTTTPAGKLTGLQALLTAQGRLGVTPRILGAPALDTLPVAGALAILAQQLGGFAYCRAQGETKEDAVKYREGFGQRELMLIWPDFTAWDTATSTTVTAYSTGRALGLRAALDEQVGWHKTISNVVVNGVTGISQDVFWSLTASGTDADYLNSHDITTLVNHDGYRFWGSRTCSADPAFCFESYTRTAQVLKDSIARAQFWAVDKPMSVMLLKDIVEEINDEFRSLKKDGYIIDGSAWFDVDENPPDGIKGGKAKIDYDYCPVPPLEQLGFIQRITDRYLVDFSKQIAG